MKRNFGYIEFPNRGGGFFSNFFSAVSTIVSCHVDGLIPYVDAKKTAFAEGYDVNTNTASPNTENPWDWWFIQDAPTNDDSVRHIALTNRNFSHSERVWRRGDIPYTRSIADKYVRVKPHILKQIDEYYDNYLKNHVVLGVMARGSEMNAIHPQYGNQTIETWIASTKDVLKKHPEIDTIFLVTEDSNYIPIFLNEFPNTLYIRDVFRKTNEKLEDMIKFSLFYCIANTRENHSKLLGEECLVQGLLLSKCNYLLVKQRGTSSAAIFYANENLKDVIYA